MNENEKMTDVSTEIVENVETIENVDNADVIQTEAVCEEYDQDNSDVLSHPMFSHFARGKRGNIEDICRDFKEMLASVPQNGIRDITAKMTPSVSANASPDIALTERQRMIARAAGMSYREYYALVNDVPARRGKY